MGYHQKRGPKPRDPSTVKSENFYGSIRPREMQALRDRAAREGTSFNEALNRALSEWCDKLST